MLLGTEHHIPWTKPPVGIGLSQGSDELGDLSRVLDALLIRFGGALSQRSEALDRLAASEARYNALANTLGGFIARMTPDLRLSFVSDAYCRYYRRNREELLGRGFNEFTLMVLDDRERHTAHLFALTPENPNSCHRAAMQTARWQYPLGGVDGYGPLRPRGARGRGSVGRAGHHRAENQRAGPSRGRFAAMDPGRDTDGGPPAAARSRDFRQRGLLPICPQAARIPPVRGVQRARPDGPRGSGAL